MNTKEHPVTWQIQTYPANVNGIGPRMVAELHLNGNPICQAFSTDPCDLNNPDPSHETQAIEALYLKLSQKLGAVWDFRK